MSPYTLYASDFSDSQPSTFQIFPPRVRNIIPTLVALIYGADYIEQLGAVKSVCHNRQGGADVTFFATDKTILGDSGPSGFGMIRL